MRTRYSWSTVSTMAEPKTRLVSLVARRRAAASQDGRPAALGSQVFGAVRRVRLLSVDSPVIVWPWRPSLTGLMQRSFCT
jgi:hypothetical protein